MPRMLARVEEARDLHLGRPLHERDLVGRGDEVGAAVERVDALGVPKPDTPEHLLDALRLRAHLADDVLRLLRQERRVERALGEEAADELLVLLREAIGLGVAEVGEVAAERVPEVRGAVGLERREELGEDLVAEELAVRLDEEEAHVGDEETEAFGHAPVVGREHEPADLRRPVVRVADAQRRVGEVLVERLRVTLLVDDVEIDVGRVASAELPEHHRRADDLVLLRVDEDKDVLPLADGLDVAGEAVDRALEDAANLLAIVR